MQPRPTLYPQSSQFIPWISGKADVCRHVHCMVHSLRREVCLWIQHGANENSKTAFGEMYYQTVSNAVQNYKGLSRWAMYNGDYSRGTCTIMYGGPATNIV